MRASSFDMVPSANHADDAIDRERDGAALFKTGHCAAVAVITDHAGDVAG